MLALLPQPVPSSDMRSPRTLSPCTPRAVVSMSLPTPPSQQPLYSQQSQPQSRRPKLSLNTAAAPAIVSRNTSLRLDTLSGASPTTRNTFANSAWGQKQAPTPQTSRCMTPQSRPRLTIDLSRTTKRVSLVYTNTPSSASTPQTAIPTIITSDADSDSDADSTSSTSSSDAVSRPPYRVPFNINSILTNGPIPRKRRINTPRRALFPTAKKVVFRTNLTEEIQNRVYVLTNNDIDSPLPTASSFSAFRARTPVTARRVGGFEAAPLKVVAETQTPADEDVCPVTPAVGRSKRTRDWVWTLGPVGNGDVGTWEGSEEE